MFDIVAYRRVEARLLHAIKELGDCKKRRARGNATEDDLQWAQDLVIAYADQLYQLFPDS